MAKYFGGACFEVPFIADQDLTGHQYKHVGFASTFGYVASANSACAPGPIGILTNDPSAGQEARVVVWGFTKAYVKDIGSCDLRQGHYLKAGSTGRLELLHGAGNGCIIFARYYGPAETVTDTCFVANVFVMPTPASIANTGATAGGTYYS